jgi:hypothetical protein
MDISSIKIVLKIICLITKNRTYENSSRMRQDGVSNKKHRARSNALKV